MYSFLSRVATQFCRIIWRLFLLFPNASNLWNALNYFYNIHTILQIHPLLIKVGIDIDPLILIPYNPINRNGYTCFFTIEEFECILYINSNGIPVKNSWAMRPHGMATSSGSSGIPFTLIFRLISALVIYGKHCDES